MRGHFFRISEVLLFAVSVACAAKMTDDTTRLPILDRNSAKGLKIQCALTTNTFVVGQPVNLWCTVTNTTNSIKPLGWHPSGGLYFKRVRSDQPGSGIGPLALPQIHEAIQIKSDSIWHSSYILFLPPSKSLTMLLTYKPDKTEKFKGRIFYDPVPMIGSGLWTREMAIAKEKELISSNEFEYEVIAETENKKLQ
jgi:hypothetical protein